jgi:glycine oxidase
LIGVFYFCTMIDYLIVGSGLAGIAFAECALQHGKSILVFDNHSQQSSKIAGGLYNPVILKRFSGIANAQEQLDQMNLFYDQVESRLGTKLNHPMPVLRKFVSIEEQNNWFSASDKQTLSAFLSTQLVAKKYNGIDSPLGFGEVLQTGYADTQALLVGYQKFLSDNGLFTNVTFDYSLLKINDDQVQYQGRSFRHVVFAEGYGIHSNPYFNYLPLDGTKGELFIIKAPELNLDVIVNTSVFILPLGNGLFKVGATYNWLDKTETPTAEGKAELIERIKEILQCDFEIISHQAGIRPTVKDRKALVGTHHVHKNLHLLNGLGTRGVMLGPAMAKTLFDHIESGTTLPREIDIKRFKLS